MTKIRFIFVFIFLAGMIFTVFQFIPILEEENAGHKIELLKKIKQNCSGDGDSTTGSDEDCDDDHSGKDLNHFFPSVHASYHSGNKALFPSGNNMYKYLLEHECSRPPRA